MRRRPRSLMATVSRATSSRFRHAHRLTKN
jgi:hypothetical protein